MADGSHSKAGVCQLNGSEPGETAQAEMELEGNEFLPHVTPSSLLDLFLDDSEHLRGFPLWPTSLPSQPHRACPEPFHGVFPAFCVVSELLGIGLYRASLGAEPD